MKLPFWLGVATIAVVALGTMVTRFLPFLLFPPGREPPRFVKYLGQTLPFAVIGLLVVYCLKDVAWSGRFHGLPELIGVACVAGLQLWKRSALLSIAGGTAVYMLLVNFVFIGSV